MQLIRTRVHDDAGKKLDALAKEQGMSTYEYVQQVLLAVARGHIRVVVEAEAGKTILSRNVKG